MRILQDDNWQEQLRLIVDLMRDMSLQTDPQEMVRSYAEKMRVLLPNDGRMSLSRRGLTAPTYRITRSTTWQENINPWKEKARLPVFDGGLLARLIYANQPQVIDELEVSSDDPAYEYLAPHRSLMAIPMFDQGVALNMVVLLRSQPYAFAKEELPEVVWLSNLFGRAANNLVMAEDLQRANLALDREMKAVGEIQRSLLPAKTPSIPTLDLATHYQPSHRAGGDYYDFFPLSNGRWGIFIGDVSGHGTPAAVLMAVTHCMAHTNPESAQTPSQILGYLNHHLATLYTNQTGRFITAFYGIYDPHERTLHYACAGHNPPRLKRCQDGSLLDLNQAGGLPLGIMSDTIYVEALQQLQPGDQIVFYTDGIIEARNTAGKLYGTEGLDQVLENCALQASSLLEAVLQSVEDFVDGHPADDDRTLIVARVS